MKKSDFLLVNSFENYLANLGYNKKTVEIYKTRVFRNIFGIGLDFKFHVKSFFRQVKNACQLWKSFISANMPQKTVKSIEIKANKPIRKRKDVFTLSLF